MNVIENMLDSFADVITNKFCIFLQILDIKTELRNYILKLIVSRSDSLIFINKFYK